MPLWRNWQTHLTQNQAGNTVPVRVRPAAFDKRDGIYYWTLDGEFIVVDGQKIKAQGTDGNNGTDGSDLSLIHI